MSLSSTNVYELAWQSRERLLINDLSGQGNGVITIGGTRWVIWKLRQYVKTISAAEAMQQGRLWLSNTYQEGGVFIHLKVCWSNTSCSLEITLSEAEDIKNAVAINILAGSIGEN